MLGVVGSNLKMVKFFICRCCMMLWSFGQVCATMLRPGMRTSSLFNSQHVAAGWPNACNNVAFKCCDHLAGACKCWANNVGICYVEMSRSFGLGLSPMIGDLSDERWTARCLGKGL